MTYFRVVGGGDGCFFSIELNIGLIFTVNNQNSPGKKYTYYFVYWHDNKDAISFISENRKDTRGRHVDLE